MIINRYIPTNDDIKNALPDSDPTILRMYNQILKYNESILGDIRSLFIEHQVDTKNEIRSNEYASMVRIQLGRQWSDKVFNLFPGCPDDKRLSFLHSIIGIELYQYILKSPFKFAAFKGETERSGYYVYVSLNKL